MRRVVCSRYPAAACLVAAIVYGSAFAASVAAQGPVDVVLTPTSLKGIPVPEPPNLGDFVQNRAAAIALGKALFWDMQASSDNLLACASCHYHAGADIRVKNAINPDLNNVAGAPLSTRFDPVASGNKGGPNYTLKTTDFPFHQLLNPADRESTVLHDANDVAGSAGVYNAEFGRVLTIVERNKYAPDGVFQVGKFATRRVEPRNTPTVINAVLAYRNFWDGRANSVFNGVTPFGARDQGARVWIDDPYTDSKTKKSVARATAVAVRIPLASAASQAVGPPLSAFEMSASGRVFADLGHKFLTTIRPLLYQQIAKDDSVLGKYRYSTGFGLNASYETLIKQAFWPDFWQTPDAAFKTSSGTSYRQIEMNFSLFWGLAIQLYESTLISDDSRFDRYAAGDKTALTALEQQGFAVFLGDGKCVNCHKGAEFTSAATRLQVGSGGDGVIERMIMHDFQTAIYDNGFYNTGVTPSGNDVGAGGTDPWGNGLSYTREYKRMLGGALSPERYAFFVDPCLFSVDRCVAAWGTDARDAVDGSFKTPSLRNVELTGPYFHNGSTSTLEQVVEFYNRGGNARLAPGGDTSGRSPNGTNLAPDMEPLHLTPTQQTALVAFLKALTDDRVRWEKAPFDHPSLAVPHGALGDNVSVKGLLNNALDEFLLIPATGAGGLGALKLPAIQPFAPKKP